MVSVVRARPTLACALALCGCNAISGVGDLDFSSAGSGGPGGGGGEGATQASASTSTSTATGGGSICGNGKLEPPEECDDGNTTAADGCSPACIVECSAPDELEDPTNHHCYWLSGSAAWSHARTVCQSWRDLGDLAVIASERERVFVKPMLTHYTWIGGLKGSAGWAWVDGEPWVEPIWGSGQPDGSGECLGLDQASNFHIDDDNCAANRDYLCEAAPAGS